jgi:Tol biopolymer transport system component
VVASFSGEFKDLEPMFTPDGKRLFFASNRPLFENDKSTDYNIWYVDRIKNGWSVPVALDTIINTEKDEFYPSLTSTGTLYFTATRLDSKGKEDIYFSKNIIGVFGEPASLDSAINSATYEFNAYVSPNEDYILFSSYGRKDGYGGGDLYISYRENGKWLPAQNLGKKVNSTSLDYCPFVSADGKTLYFTSGRRLIEKKSSMQSMKKSMNSPQNGFDDIYEMRFDEIRRNNL